MTEIEKFDISRKQLAKASQNELADLKVKILAGPAEISWINKALEAALLVELFNRKGSYDRDLYHRVFFTVEDLAVFKDLLPIRRNETRALPALPHTATSRVLFLSSKFGNYVSSQEYVGSVLRKLGDGVQVVLASNQPIAENYSSEFEVYSFKQIGDLREICKIAKIDKLVDLSGNYYDIRQCISKEVHIADVWGEPLAASVASSSLAWSEFERYLGYIFNPVSVGAQCMMFLPPQSQLREYPEIKENLTPIKKDAIILGAFCRTAKLNMRVVRLWAKIMSANPATILMFAFIQSNEKSEKLVKRIFADCGVSIDRVSFLPRMDTTAYLEQLNSVDINLGAMPEQGGVSCMDSILMGCPYPICQQLSNTFPASIVLQALGLDDWIAETEDEYRDLLHRLIENIAVTRLKEIRNSIRSKLLHSPLSNPNGVATVWNKFLRTPI